EPGRYADLGALAGSQPGKKQYGNPPLALSLSRYPAFESLSAYEYMVDSGGYENPVEVDIYEDLHEGTSAELYIGMDIGSTSTKAVWLGPDRRVLAGFYIRTAGRPVDSMRGVLAAMDDVIKKRRLDVRILGAGTTGSGRRFVGRIIGADIIIDEITAHARAACELNPDVDTIIEIGGQDSKFTTLQDGRVTRSIMNTVCAAGTGSFIEEQARKLGCPLSRYAERAEQVWSPAASDRCTVFMERDINYYLSRGYSVDEVLATALHSVRENYLAKVAEPRSIGDVIFFQGATAKNRALVAAFEQKLQKPILVSRFCHLTGAMGVALQLLDEAVKQSGFRGISLYWWQIPVRKEVCSYCTNHCKITIAEMPDGPVAFGFLCGRDYNTRRFVDNNSSGFDLIRTRRRLFRFAPQEQQKSPVTVGIPAALYLYEDVECWQQFFAAFGIRTITSQGVKDAVKTGKKYTGAEFCAPISALYGHVRWLLDRADYIFMPYYLDNKEKGSSARRQYCYYSQFVPSLVSGLGEDSGRFLRPVVKYIYSSLHDRMQLYRMLKRIAGRRVHFFDVARALDSAFSQKSRALMELHRIYLQELEKREDISVVLLGRPYTVLSPAMNKGIPSIFGSFGVKAFFQDMLCCRDQDQDPYKSGTAEIAPLLEDVHWNYAARIISAAAEAARTPGVYPVFITSFKCAPDAFVKDVIKDIMAACRKPYLVLELDEHDSSVGYETRIEAAIRAFRNHYSMTDSRGEEQRPASLVHLNRGDNPALSGKTLVLPNWDPITCRLLVENLRREGVDARLMEQTPEMVQQSMSLNSGQCIPLNVIVQGYVDCLRKHDLDPAKSLLWMGKSEIACHLGLYPYEMQQMLNRYSGRMRQTGVYAGPLSFTDISMRAAINTYFAFMFGGMLRKLICRVRPYETVKGVTDQVADQSLEVFCRAFAGRMSKEDAASEVVRRFEQIPVQPGKRPRAAIFGDLFVRDNPVMNQDLLRFIEACGGEAITTPYTDYIKMIARSYFRKWFTEGRYMEVFRSRTLLMWLAHMEKTYFRCFNSILDEAEPSYDAPPAKILSPYRMIAEQTGESMDNILKIYYLCQHFPDLSLFIQTSPALCCPSLVTEAMSSEIEAQTGIPVVSLTYDGTWEEKNPAIIPYLQFPRSGAGEKGQGRRLTVVS
ncbi:MAG: acyl-CoA dehydratase activase, partial [Desulfosalsimonadaceae bacterium]